MAKEYKGNACAYMKGPNDAKGRYIKIGNWFEDEDGRISLVLDTVPLPHTPWTGWINLFEHADSFAPRPKQTASTDVDGEDDIPF